MKNNKGQALVEFILVLPVFLLLIISFIDLGNIITKKYTLESELDTVSSMYNEEQYNKINEYLNNKDIKINYNKNNGFLNIKISKDINIISPIFNLIFGKTYQVNAEKSIYFNE